MIHGSLKPDGRAVVPVQTAGCPLDAVIDTGLDGGLSLPDVLRPHLNLPERSRAPYQLGDGSRVEFIGYDVEFELGGDLVATEAIYSSGTEVALGVKALAG